MSFRFSGSAVQIKEYRRDNCTCDDNQPCYTLYASNLVERRTEVAVAICVLIAMTAETLSNDGHVINFTTGVQFIADITIASPALIWIDKVRCA